MTADRGRRARLRLAALGVAALTLVPGGAAATPGEGVTAETLATGTSAGALDLRTRGATDVTMRVITIEPGGSTGWHYHPGGLLAVVASGTLTRVVDGCAVEVSTAGDAVLEPAGADHVHIGRNLGSEPVVLYATYLVPEGSPLAVDAEDPGCEAP
ncbi:cupin domain-containing protein [Streptomyces sp. NPDC127098]|uniref:cupin domain-containing protein n=1 Tax=Streptomyces sp. NPDC127098 TaxID=3347137 RepID=UPI003649921A